MTIRGRGLADSWNVKLVGQTDLDGHGDCMLVNVQDDIAYVGHHGWGSRRYVRSLMCPTLRPPPPFSAAHAPGTHSHKVQVVGDLLLVRSSKTEIRLSQILHCDVRGWRVYDIGIWRSRGLSFS